MIKAVKWDSRPSHSEWQPPHQMTPAGRKSIAVSQSIAELPEYCLWPQHLFLGAQQWNVRLIDF
jgi:hypothetical protein